MKVHTESGSPCHGWYLNTWSKANIPATRHSGAWGERRYSSYSCLTSALHGGEWSASRPGRALPRGKGPRYPLYRRLGGPQSGLDTEDRGKILCPCRGSNPDRPVVQPVVRHYTAWANSAPNKIITSNKYIDNNQHYIGHCPLFQGCLSP
jgi:hypothetical protein